RRISPPSSTPSRRSGARWRSARTSASKIDRYSELTRGSVQRAEPRCVCSEAHFAAEYVRNDTPERSQRRRIYADKWIGRIELFGASGLRFVKEPPFFG